jgi:hypothetical protein
MVSPNAIQFWFVFIRIFTRPSLSAGVRFQDQRAKTKSATNSQPAQQCFSIIFLMFSFPCRRIVMRAVYFLPSTPWTSCGMNPRPVRVVEPFWRSNALKGPSDFFLFLRATSRICETAKGEGWVYLWASCHSRNQHQLYDTHPTVYVNGLPFLLHDKNESSNIILMKSGEHTNSRISMRRGDNSTCTI